jgi:hypothetical protein
VDTKMIIDEAILWKPVKETPLQQHIRSCIGRGEKLSCFWCQLVWTAGPVLRLAGTRTSVTMPETHVITCRPYTDVWRRGVCEVAKGDEWPPHLVCADCASEMIALDKKRANRPSTDLTPRKRADLG